MEDNRNAASLTKVQNDILQTSQGLAHEMAHNLGIGHDFAQTKLGRTKTCGPGKGEPGGDLMNYGSPRNSEWSECSKEDFLNYLQRILQTGHFCIQSGKLQLLSSTK